MTLTPVDILNAEAARLESEGNLGAALAGMQEAVKWVLSDAAYKAPEQIGDVAQRWLDRLRAISPADLASRWVPREEMEKALGQVAMLRETLGLMFSGAIFISNDAIRTRAISAINSTKDASEAFLREVRDKAREECAKMLLDPSGGETWASKIILAAREGEPGNEVRGDE